MAFGAANSIYCDKIISYSKRVRRKCSARATARFVLNALAKPRLYSEWFTYVECRIPEGVPQDTAMRLVEHSARHYVRRGFGVREMMTIVRCHYDLFAERFPPSALREMNVFPGVVLSEVTGKGGGRYQITLLQRATREGEIEFYFWDTKLSARLARIRGVIGPDSTGRKAFWVGTLQGPLPPLGRAEISAATRDLCGLRPKQALLHAISAFCASVGVDMIYAPPNKNHVSYRWWRSWLGEQSVRSSYDSFWEEMTSDRTPWGDFRLALPLSRRKLEDVDAKKRKNWIRRYAYVDSLSDNIRAVVAALHRPPLNNHVLRPRSPEIGERRRVKQESGSVRDECAA